MKTKQLIAALLALLLALSLPAASAAESPAPDAGGLINVIVPSTGHMVINPYRLAVRPDGVETTAQLVHAPQVLTNLSDFPVTVNVTATASLPRESEAVFVHAPPAPDAKAKEVFLYAEFQVRPDWWEGAYLDLPNQLPVSPRGASAGNVLALALARWGVCGGGLDDFAAQFCETLSKSCGAITAVTDRDSVIAVAGGGKRELMGKRISPQLEQIMEDRRIYQHAGEERSIFVTESGDKYRTAVAAPIISEGDVLGLVLFVEDGENLVTGETEYKLAQTIAAFLGKHMES